MAGRRRRRTAAASGISLALHGLFLAAMVFGVRAVKPPPEAPPIEVQLIPAFIQPKPVPAPTPPPAPSAAAQRAQPSRPVLTPHISPQPAPLPAVPLPEAAKPAPPAPPAPPSAVAVQGAPKGGLLPSLTGRLGCDDPASFHLTKAQMDVCEQKFAETAKTAKPLALDIATARMAELERNRRCHDIYTRGGIPQSGGHNDSTGQINGLGYNPSFKECRPEDR